LKGGLILQAYYIMRPKQGLVLNENLVWKKFMQYTEQSAVPALGLDIEDALRVASWLSYDGVTAITYPESTLMCSAEKELGQFFSIPVHPMSRAEFEKKARQGVYPSFLLRKPANKMEKKMLCRQLGKNVPEKNNDSPFVNVMKEQMEKSEFICKGDETVYYIVKPKKGMFLTKAFEWISIDELRRDRKLLNQLFTVKDSISRAQNVCQWAAVPGETVSPCTPGSLKRRFNMSFPNPIEDSLKAGLRTHKYPSFLERKPTERKEIAAFQMELRHGLKGLEDRVVQALGRSKDMAVGIETGAVLDTLDPEAAAVVELLEARYDDLQLKEQGAADAVDDEVLSGEPPSEYVREFKNWSVSVMESSDLIRRMVESALSFGELINDVPNLLAQRKLDLEMVQRQLVDLDHMAEFYNLNASDGFRLNKSRQAMLQKRRIVKNEIFALELASNYLESGATPTKIHSFINSIMGMDRRRYMPRAMTVSDVKKIVQNPRTQNIILGGAE